MERLGQKLHWNKNTKLIDSDDVSNEKPVPPRFSLSARQVERQQRKMELGFRSVQDRDRERHPEREGVGGREKEREGRAGRRMRESA